VTLHTETPAATARVEAEDLSRLTPRLRVILAIVILATMLDLLDSQITNIAAPSIVRDLGGGESLIKWLGASYQLAMGTFLVLGGRLGDRYGKRRMFLIGISGFVAASLMCGLAVGPVMIIVGRLIQGSFGAMLIPQGVSIIMLTFSRQQLPRAFSTFGPVLGLSAVLGPIVGGFIISANLAGLHWRPVFLINIVLGTAGLVAAIFLLPHDRPISNERIDALGCVVLGLMMLSFIFGLIQGSTDGWTALPIIALVLGAALLVAFAIRQRQAAHPLIRSSLLQNRGFTSGLILGLAFFAAMAGIMYLISLFFQLVRHYSADQASLTLAPAAASFVVASFVGRSLLERLGRTLLFAGLVVALLGALGLWLTVLARGTSVTGFLTLPSIFVLGLGMGMCITSLYQVAIGDVTQDEAGSASGSFSAVQQLATALGAAVVTSVYFDVNAVHGGVTAMTVSCFTVAMIIAVCLGLVWLLPRNAAPEELPQ
jgi:EmrB/QacA subfamily drug resistance transporter